MILDQYFVYSYSLFLSNKVHYLHKKKLYTLFSYVEYIIQNIQHEDAFVYIFIFIIKTVL